MAKNGALLENINELADGLSQRYSKSPRDATTVCSNALGLLVAKIDGLTRKEYFDRYDNAAIQGRLVLKDVLDDLKVP